MAKKQHSATERLAEFISETDYEHIPDDARNEAKKAILDWLGVTLAASREPVVNKVADYSRRAAVVSESSVIGKGFKTTAELAAWVNGIAGHALDYDDTFAGRDYNMHPTVPVLPAVLALAEWLDLAGTDIITAYVIGIEIESRIGDAIGRDNSVHGWHPTAVLGTIGATAACASILKLTTDQACMALGIAGSLASGLQKNIGTMTKPMHAGNAAKNGIIVSLLAKEGFTGNDNIFEEDYSFSNVLSAGHKDGLDGKEQDLGKNWHIVSPGMGYKAYPSCRSTHSSIDASLYLRDTIGIDPSRIAKIVCRTSRRHTQLARFHNPSSGYEGKFSIPYCIATALLKGKVVLDDFTDEKVAGIEARSLLTKVEFEYPDAFQKTVRPDQEVLIILDDGSEYSHRVASPKGYPENPMSDSELSTKFEECTNWFLSKKSIDRVVDLVMNLELLESTAKLMKNFMNREI